MKQVYVLVNMETREPISRYDLRFKLDTGYIMFESEPDAEKYIESNAKAFIEAGIRLIIIQKIYKL